MPFLIDRQYMPHEGGTKFYQVMRVQRLETPGGTPGMAPVRAAVATLTNWGKQVGEPGWVRPVERGESQLHNGDVYAKYLSTKSKRGYINMIAHGTTDKIATFEQFKEFIDEQLGAVKGTEFMAKLGFGPGETSVMNMGATPATTPAARAAAAVEYEIPMASADMEGYGEF